MDAAAVLTSKALLRPVPFGSRAHGYADPDADECVAIVVRGLDVETKDRIPSIVTGIELAHLVSLSTLILSEPA